MKKQKIKCSTHISTRPQAVEFAEKIIRSFCMTPELGLAMTHCSVMFSQSRRHFGAVCSLSPNREITLLGKTGIPRVEFVPCTWDSLRDQGADAKTIDAFRENDWETMFPVIVACPYGYETESGVNFSIAWTVRFVDSADVILSLGDAIRKEKIASVNDVTAQSKKGERLEDILFAPQRNDAKIAERYFQALESQSHQHQQSACDCRDPHCAGKRKKTNAAASARSKRFPVTFIGKSCELYGGRKCDMPDCDERARGQCPQCKLAAYCAAKCQTLHWAAGHKFTCGQPLPEPMPVSKDVMAAAIALSAQGEIKHDGVLEESKEKPKIKRTEPGVFYFFAPTECKDWLV